jgi:putative ABC transport system permease protein
MGIAFYSFVVVFAAILGVLSIIAAAIAVAGSVLSRASVLRKEVATRRACGARRSDIARMFLSENVLWIAAGVVIGSAAALATGWIVLISSGAVLIAAALLGGWMAGRLATRTRSDSRGQ